MISVHPQYIKDSNGKKSFVILPAKEFEVMIENLEELEDIRLYDQAKKEDKGERILFSDYLKKRNKKNG
jgi:PHD/YefM family antitoxin component YafN of YafNO toxin-antitoxin module